MRGSLCLLGEALICATRLCFETCKTLHQVVCTADAACNWFPPSAAGNLRNPQARNDAKAVVMAKYGSIRAHQNAPTLRPGLCASMKGMEPYSPKGESAACSKTSRLYSRYGSDSDPLPPAQTKHDSCAADFYI